MAFSQSTMYRALERQDWQCAHCGKGLVEDNRVLRKKGAWHAHHRKPVSRGGKDSLRNCVILCVNYPQSCHINIGHGGWKWAYYVHLSNNVLPYLYG